MGWLLGRGNGVEEGEEGMRGEERRGDGKGDQWEYKNAILKHVTLYVNFLKDN